MGTLARKSPELTIKEVARRRAIIRRDAVYDDESAHAGEKSLWRDVLTCIARGESSDPQQLAASALLTTRISFSRWFA